MSELERLGDALNGRTVSLWRDVLGRWNAHVNSLNVTFPVKSLDDLAAKIETASSREVVVDAVRVKEVAAALYRASEYPECPVCGGSGAEGERPCRNCEGFGTLLETSK